MTLTRITDWATALAVFLESRDKAPFVWGANDCALFAADAVLAITGHDLGSDRGRYRTAKGAAGVLRRHGVDSVGALAERRLLAVSAPPVAVEFARRGDVGVAALEGRETLVIRISGAWIGPGAEGTLTVPVASRAWAVGWPGR